MAQSRYRAFGRNFLGRRSPRRYKQAITQFLLHSRGANCKVLTRTSPPSPATAGDPGNNSSGIGRTPSMGETR